MSLLSSSSSKLMLLHITQQLMITYIFLFLKAQEFSNAKYYSFIKFTNTEYYSFMKIYEYRIPNSIRNLKINEYRIPNSIRNLKLANTEYRIVLFGPNYSRIPKNRIIRCNSDLDLPTGTELGTDQPQLVTELHRIIQLFGIRE